MVVVFDSSHVVFDLMPQILLGLWLQTIQTWRHADLAISWSSIMWSCNVVTAKCT